LACLGLQIGCQLFVSEKRISDAVNEIAPQLKFQLGKLEPKVSIEIPFSQSRLDISTALVIENPTATQIKAESFSGKLEIEQKGATHFLGNVVVKEAISIPAKGTGNIPIALTLRYRDIQNAWKSIANLALGQATEWKLSGNVEVLVHNKPFSIPVQFNRATGDAQAIQAE
jgi:LEA14-like dessication related protein